MWKNRGIKEHSGKMTEKDRLRHTVLGAPQARLDAIARLSELDAVGTLIEIALEGATHEERALAINLVSRSRESKDIGRSKMNETTTTDSSAEVCGACRGKGYQMNVRTSINELCPVCGGTGKRRRKL